MHTLIFWQQIANDHMAGLINELSLQGHDVTYIVREAVSDIRAKLGWTVPEMTGARFITLETDKEAFDLLDTFPKDAIHLTEGIRSNGYVSDVIQQLIIRQARWGVMMETVNDTGPKGFFKRLLYQKLLISKKTRPDFILAIGRNTPDWLTSRGYPDENIYPFCYFLADKGNDIRQRPPSLKTVRIGFVGQFIKRKRVDILINALAKLENCCFELVTVGTGWLEKQLKELAIKNLGEGRVRFYGQLSMQGSQEVIASLDVLVLPSDHDGWGAVVSESLMSGVPAICSTACGAAVIVKKSGVGGVFAKGDVDGLSQLLRNIVASGSLTLVERQKIYIWAKCIGAGAGAEYTQAVIESIYHGATKPIAPFFRVSEKFRQA